MRSQAGPIVFSVVLLLLGVWSLWTLSRVDPAAVRGLVGATLLLGLVTLWVVRPAPRERIRRGWAYLAYGATGYLSGLAGMGGPPVVVWTMAHDWPTTRTRLVLWTSFVVLVPVQLVVLFVTFGKPALWAALLGLLLFPGVYAGTWVGLWLGARMSRGALRVATHAMLVMLALVSLWGWWRGG